MMHSFGYIFDILNDVCGFPLIITDSHFCICLHFVGITLKEQAPNSAGTLVDVGLSKVWFYDNKFADPFFSFSWYH